MLCRNKDWSRFLLGSFYLSQLVECQPFRTFCELGNSADGLLACLPGKRLGQTELSLSCPTSLLVTFSLKSFSCLISTCLHA